MSGTFIFENFMNGFINLDITCGCKEQAEAILKYVVLQPEHFRFLMEV